MKRFLILIACLLVIQFSSFAQNQSKDAKPEEQIRKYWFVMLLKGSNRTQDSATAVKLQEGHMANITRLYNEGKIKVAGPFGDNGNWRGIFIFDCETKEEVEQLLNQVIQVSNRKLGDRYIFGGFRTNMTPFNRSGEYLGDNGEIKIQINKDAYVTMNVPGNKIFLGEGSVNNLDGIDVPKNSGELEQYKSQIQQEDDLRARQIPLAQV